MKSILHYFSDLEQHPVQRLIFLVGGLVFFWILEGEEDENLSLLLHKPFTMQPRQPVNPEVTEAQLTEGTGKTALGNA